jgi:hypothetical protein
MGVGERRKVTDFIEQCFANRMSKDKGESRIVYAGDAAFECLVQSLYAMWRFPATLWALDVVAIREWKWEGKVFMLFVYDEEPIAVLFSSVHHGTFLCKKESFYNEVVWI